MSSESDRPLLIAALSGGVAGLVGFQGFGATGRVAAVIGILYAAAGYFYAASGSSALEPTFSFAERSDAIAYGVGLFGLGLSPMAFGQYYTDADVDPVFLLWFVGTIAFLLFASRAAFDDAEDS